MVVAAGWDIVARNWLEQMVGGNAGSGADVVDNIFFNFWEFV